MSTEQTCSECGEVNDVTKSYNCVKCRAWNRYEEAKSAPKPKKDKKWLS